MNERTSKLSLSIEQAELLERFLEQARSDTSARKHHIVPATYLRRWTQGGKLRITDTQLRSSRPTAAEKAGRVSDFYRLTSPDLDSHEFPPLMIEKLLGHVEAAAKAPLDNLIVKGPEGISDLERFNIAQFFAFQYVRGQHHIAVTKQSAKTAFQLHFGNLSEDAAREFLRSTGKAASEEEVALFQDFQRSLLDGKIAATPQDDAVIAMALQGVEGIHENLYEREWVLYRTPRILLTSDEPIVPIAGPGHPREARAGYSTAHVIVAPVGPDSLLAMFNSPIRPHWRADLSLIEIADLNREVAANSQRWLFELPTRSAGLKLDLPPWPSKSQRADETPVPGTNDSILRTYVASRWADTTPMPAWPVARWFS